MGTKGQIGDKGILGSPGDKGFRGPEGNKGLTGPTGNKVKNLILHKLSIQFIKKSFNRVQMV